MRRRDEGSALTGAAIRDLQALDRALAGEPLEAEQADLATLVEAVRGDAPRIDPAFAQRLDERLTQGLGRRGALGRLRALAVVPKRPRLMALGTALGVAVAVAVVILVAGGSGQRSSVTAEHGPRPLAAQHPSAAATEGAGASVPAPPSVGSQPRAVQRDATLALSAARGALQRVADSVVRATDRFGGIVESSNVTLDDHGGSQADFQLLVPAARFDAALAAYSALAHVGSRSQSVLDITDQTRAAGDRLAADRAERLSLLRQLAQATNPNQVASIRAQLELVGGRIRQDERALQDLQRRSRFATLRLTVTESQSSPSGAAGTGWDPGDALRSARDVLEVTLGVLVVGAAALVPLALLTAPAWWAALALRRRRREHALGPLV
jgi:hypothetical protein